VVKLKQQLGTYTNYPELPDSSLKTSDGV